MTSIHSFHGPLDAQCSAMQRWSLVAAEYPFIILTACAVAVSRRHSDEDRISFEMEVVRVWSPQHTPLHAFP